MAQPKNVVEFWRQKSLAEMTVTEWESLCDGCGRCCLNKLQDEDTNEIHLTSVACKLLDVATCRCRDYPNRAKHVPDCVALSPKNVPDIVWLPDTCAYRLVGEGRDLFPWHPLKSGRAESVHEAGIAVTWAKTERRIKPKNFRRYIIDGYPQRDGSE